MPQGGSLGREQNTSTDLSSDIMPGAMPQGGSLGREQNPSTDSHADIMPGAMPVCERLLKGL